MEWGTSLKYNTSRGFSLFKSLRFRVWIVFVLFVTMVLSFLFLAQSVLMPTIYQQMKMSENISTANEIKDKWDLKNTPRLIECVDSLAQQQQMDILINFPAYVTGAAPITYSTNKSGAPYSITQRVSDAVIEQLKNSSDGSLTIFTTDTNKMASIYATYVGSKNYITGYIFIYNYLEPVGTTYKILQTIYITTSVLIIAAAIIAAFWVAQSIATPIEKLSRSAGKLIVGEFNVQIDKNEFEEIAILTENLNLASEEIAHTEALRKDLVANVSHDLRTPLTMIKAYAEMIRDLSGNNPEKRERHLQVIIEEADRLTELVTDMFDLSKMQSGVMKFDIKTFDFSEYLGEIYSRFSLLNDDSQVSVTAEIEDGIKINGDCRRIEQAVYNLILNAMKYAGDDNTVRMRLFRTTPSRMRFEVIDNGIGIEAAQIPYIWERYYKIERSENFHREAKGTGLGLSIVKNIFEAHRFRYGVESTVGKGSTFWFEADIADDKPLLKDI